jgi:hypothetical protein
MALTEEDIINLPTNPTKSLDKRAAPYVAKYGDRCWELDALPPDILKQRVHDSIFKFINKEKWDADTKRLQSDTEEVKELVEALLKD